MLMLNRNRPEGLIHEMDNSIILIINFNLEANSVDQLLNKVSFLSRILT